jgi:hypothetical protein
MYTDADDPGFDSQCWDIPGQLTSPEAKWVGYNHEGSRVFQFGKHRGVSWDEVPVDYLKWAAMNLSNDAVAAQVDAYLIRVYRFPRDWQDYEHGYDAECWDDYGEMPH